MTPCGAGICVRKVVAEEYVSLVSNDAKRLSLDQKGKSLMICGDTNLALTTCDIGLGIGQFKSLKLNHLIPPNRMQEEYLMTLAEGIEYSHKILESFRNKKPDVLGISWQRRLLEYYKLSRMSPKDRRIYKASKIKIYITLFPLQDYLSFSWRSWHASCFNAGNPRNALACLGGSLNR